MSEPDEIGSAQIRKDVLWEMSVGGGRGRAMETATNRGASAIARSHGTATITGAGARTWSRSDLARVSLDAARICSTLQQQAREIVVSCFGLCGVGQQQAVRTTRSCGHR
jgi:hypothetical protein